MTQPMHADNGLAALEARVKHDLACLSYPAKAWVEPLAAEVEGPVLDCALIGGGQFGVALAFGLTRECVGNIMVYDRNPAGAEGPWMSFARMDMLRTPKDLTGPDLGIGSLTFRAWYEAQHGCDGWQKLMRIPRPVWMDFLRWYRRVLDLPVTNDTEVVAVEPLSPRLFRLTLKQPAGIGHVHARTVVFCSGAEGSGGRVVPDFIAKALPPNLFAHTNDDIDLASLQGKSIGLLGAGASAFDNAATALEQGRRRKHICAFAATSCRYKTRGAGWSFPAFSPTTPSCRTPSAGPICTGSMTSANRRPSRPSAAPPRCRASICILPRPGKRYRWVRMARCKC